jgi:type II secretory pathway component PulM
MIQTEAAKARSRHLAASFPRLGDQEQAYLETLTAQLAEIHETSPETQDLTGKTSEDIVQQNKGQEP